MGPDGLLQKRYGLGEAAGGEIAVSQRLEQLSVASSQFQCSLQLRQSRLRLPLLNKKQAQEPEAGPVVPGDFRYLPGTLQTLVRLSIPETDLGEQQK